MKAGNGDEGAEDWEGLDGEDVWAWGGVDMDCICCSGVEMGDDIVYGVRRGCGVRRVMLLVGGVGGWGDARAQGCNIVCCSK